MTNNKVIIKRYLVNSGGIITLLAAVLIVLKALGLISLGWWWVTLPLWIDIALTLGVLAIILGIVIAAGLVFGIGYVLYLMFSYLSDKFRNK